MEFFKFLAHYSGYVQGVLILVLVILSVLLVRNTIVLNTVKKRFRDLLATSSGQDLEQLLLDHLKERQRLMDEVSKLEERTSALERRLQKSKRHLGLVRYDAFPDVGGQQSFAMAVYDDNGDGAVVSSIIGRAECRVYGKPIMNGKSERNLTNEEQQAILEAVSNAPKSFVSS